MEATLERLKAPLVPAERPSGARRLLAVVAGLGIVGLVVYAQATAPGLSGSQGIPRTALVVVWALAGAVLTTARPKESMGPVTLGAAAIGALATLGAVEASRPDASDLALLLRNIGVATLPASGLHVLLALPDGSVRKRSQMVTLAAGYALGIAVGVAAWVADAGLLIPVGAEVVLAAIVGAAWSGARYRRSSGIERQRMQWFGLAFTMGLGIAAVSGGLRLLVGWPDDGAWVAAVSTLLIPIGLAITASPRLVSRVDRLLTHSVSLAGLTGVVMLAYLVIVIGLGRVPGQEERTLLALSMAAAIVSALLYLPMRERLQSLALRIVYSDRRPPDDMLRTFGTKIFSRAFPLDELMLQLCESLRRTFELDAAEVWTGSDGRYERSISDPERKTAVITLGEKERPVVARAGVSGPAWLKVWLPELLAAREDKMIRVAPIVHASELLGWIVIEKSSSDELFDEDKERVLAELSRTCGVALHNVQLDSALQASLNELKRQAEDLRLSRQRIVASADAARRKIERDLHDGLQQHLVALSVKLGLAKNLAESDPEMAAQLHDELLGDVQMTIQSARDLSHGIYPPVLVDRGLVPALETAASRAAITTVVEPQSEIERHGQAVETAVYFCCLEAVQNAAKHAGQGSTVTITLRQEPDALYFAVSDDGAGFDAASKGSGAGFVNMRDRVGAIGGTITVDSAPGKGTTISGRVPLGS